MSEAKLEEVEEIEEEVEKKGQLLVVKEVELKNLPKIGDRILRYPNPKVVFKMSLPDSPQDDFVSIQMTKRKQKRCNVKYKDSLAFFVPGSVDRVHLKIETWHVTSLIAGSEDRLIGESLSLNLEVETRKTDSNILNFILPIGTRKKKEELTVLSFQVEWISEKDSKYQYKKSLKKSEKMMEKYEKMKKSASSAKIRFQRIDDDTELDEETTERYDNYSKSFSREFEHLKVFYVHGLESSPQGPKPTYLKGKVKFIHGMDMDISCYKLTKEVSFPKFLLKTLLSRDVIRGLNRKFVLKQMVDVCVGKQTEELKKFPAYFDLYIGSSWGGAVLIELLRHLKIIPFDAMILLLAPAQNLVNPNFEVSDQMKEKYRFVYLVHGEKDEIVGVKHSRRMDKDFGENCVYKEIKDAPHNLRVLLNDQPGGIEDIIHQMIEKRNKAIPIEEEEEGEEED